MAGDVVLHYVGFGLELSFSAAQLAVVLAVALKLSRWEREGGVGEGEHSPYNSDQDV